MSAAESQLNLLKSSNKSINIDIYNIILKGYAKEGS